MRSVCVRYGTHLLSPKYRTNPYLKEQLASLVATVFTFDSVIQGRFGLGKPKIYIINLHVSVNSQNHLKMITSGLPTFQKTFFSERFFFRFASSCQIDRERRTEFS